MVTQKGKLVNWVKWIGKLIDLRQVGPTSICWAAIIHQKWSKAKLATPLEELFSEQKNGGEVAWAGVRNEKF